MTCRAASDKRVFVRQWVLWALLAPGIGSCVNTPVEIIGTFPLGVKLNWSTFALLGMLATIVLAAVLFSTFSLIVLHCENAGTFYGNWPGPYHAALFRQQRDLPHSNHARLAPS